MEWEGERTRAVQGQRNGLPGSREEKKRGEEGGVEKEKEREREYSSSTFCSVCALKEWMMLTPIGEGGFSLLSLLSQILISSLNTLKGTTRNHVLPALWTLLSPDKLKQS